MTIELKKVRFFAYHGLYPEEKILGNDYLVDLSVSFMPSSGIISDISDTINYSSLYDLLKKQMDIPTLLLETLAMNIVASIHLEFPEIKHASISIQKLHPPIMKFDGKVGVKFEKDF